MCPFIIFSPSFITCLRGNINITANIVSTIIWGFFSLKKKKKCLISYWYNGAGGWAIWCHRAAEAPWDYSIAARQSSFVYYYIKELRRRNDSLSLSFSLFTSTSIDLLAAKGREKKNPFRKGSGGNVHTAGRPSYSLLDRISLSIE